MFGDEITIRTRRDYGVGREHGQPLVVEIKGLSGIVVIRPGSNDQPVGTTVEIRGRRKYFTVDRWSDPVNLVQVLKGYALAVEFPVTASCTVPAIQERVEISPGATARPHPLEEADVSAKDTFIGSFSEVDERLGGQVRVCTLTDEGGIPAPANTEARVKLVTGRTSMDVERKVVFASGEEAVGRWDIHRFDRVCCDGILVAGEPAWHGERLLLGYSALNTGFGGGSLLLDARGDLKPALTPARTPIDSNRQEPSWVRLFEAASPAYSKVLLQVLVKSFTQSETVLGSE